MFFSKIKQNKKKQQLGMKVGLINTNRNAFVTLFLIVPLDTVLHPEDYAIQSGHRKNLECDTPV
jgi:hypothetical protein